MMEKFFITKDGFSQLAEELEFLKREKRPQIIGAIAEARDFGDLSENAEYEAARAEQGRIEGRIIDLEDKVARAEVIDVANMDGSTVRFGATVHLVDDDTEEEVKYKIVGDYEADIKKKLISISSPLAKALIGKEQGDIVEFNTPKGLKVYEILEVSYI